MAPQPDRYEPLPSPLGLPRFLWRKLSRTGRRVVGTIGIALLAGVVAISALVLPDARSGRDERTAAEAAQARAARVERIRRIAREGRPQRGRGPAAGQLEAGEALRARRRLVAGLEAVIVADARRRVARGELRGPYRSATCFEFPKRLGQPPPAEDLRRAVARFECVAVAARVPTSDRTTGSLIGQPFRARVDFARGRFAWCKFVQRPGELSIERERAPAIAKACGG
jgi:hypothetical protein